MEEKVSKQKLFTMQLLNLFIDYKESLLSWKTLFLHFNNEGKLIFSNFSRKEKLM